MPRNVPANLLAHMQQSSVVIAVLVRIDRTDGVSLGFTGWDTDIVYGGLTYHRTISMSPSAIKMNQDLTTDQMDIIGAIDSVYLTEEDIKGGRYRLARVTVMRINPFNTGWGVITDLFGYVDSIEYGDGQIKVEIVSLGACLSQQFGDIITPACRVKQLGDSQCKVNIAAYQVSSTVAAVGADNRTLTFTDTKPNGWYDGGMVRFASVVGGGGNNFNINMEVKRSFTNGASVITLQHSPTGGTFGLTVDVDQGFPIVNHTQVAYNATAAFIQSYLEAYSNIGVGNVTVSGSAGGPWTVNFVGALSGHLVELTADGSHLTGGTTNGTATECQVTNTGGTSSTLYLVQRMPFQVQVGDAAVLEAGCDRRAITCRSKFNNLINFHGEPYVPGNDYLLKTGRPPG